MGEGGQELQETGLLGLFHLGAITSYETAPLTLIGGMQPFFDKVLRRRKIGKPHVIEITGSMLGLGYTTGRLAHGAQSQTFVGESRTSKPHY
jgi:hypothetical protein